MLKAYALSAGGKDSILALHIAKFKGIDVRGIITILPEDPESMLYHHLNARYAKLMAKSMNLEWLSFKAKKNEEEEVLSDVLKSIDANLIVTGGICSQYQRSRFERIAKKCRLSCYSPLWGLDAKTIYSKLFEFQIKAIIVGVFAYGLNEDWLGKELTTDIVNKILAVSKKYRFHPLGEGGEFETFVTDARLFEQRLCIDDYEKVWLGDRGYLKIKKVSFERK
jgi:ABC transporter with metal-binding/Fe-S-binding domain ATP-binding protein